MADISTIARVINGLSRNISLQTNTLVVGNLKVYLSVGQYFTYAGTLTATRTITAGTTVTLPASGTYDSAELEVYLNGIRADVILDYNYVGSPPRTGVQFTFDLLAGDVVRFRVDRGA